TFLMGAIVSPIWGKLGDIHGRKLMLIRASLGMAIIMTLMGFVTDVYQFPSMYITKLSPYWRYDRTH
ncbi:hypothetical protein ACT4US_07190, partial [Bacillus sp. HC-Mk]